MSNLQLGERVSFDRHLVKRHQHERDSILSRKKTIWKEVSCQYKNGIICGMRVIKEGYRAYDDKGTYFEPTKHIKVYLVAVNLNMRPYYVAVDAVKEAGL